MTRTCDAVSVARALPNVLACCKIVGQPSCDTSAVRPASNPMEFVCTWVLSCIKFALTGPAGVGQVEGSGRHLVQQLIHAADVAQSQGSKLLGQRCVHLAHKDEIEQHGKCTVNR